MDDPKRRGRTLIVCLALCLLTLAVWAGVLRNGFIDEYDDAVYVTENARIHAGPTPDAIRWAFTTFYASNWHPLTWLSHMLDCRLFGLDPAGHHAVNLLLHAGNCVLLLLFLQRTTAALWPSALVAALFAVHPLHVESVAWAAERKDVLSTTFWLLTLHAYVAWVARPGAVRYGLVLLCFAAGLMAKPMLVTLPCALLLLDLWPLERLERATLGRRLLEKGPLFAMAVVASNVTFVAQKSGGAVADFVTHPFALRAQNAVVAYATYLEKTVWPADLAVIYPYPTGYSTGAVAGAAGVLLLVTALAVWLARRAPAVPAVIVGWLWFLGTLVPVIGMVQVGWQSMADRYTYIPHIGLFVAVVFGIRALLERRPQLPTAVALATAAVLLLFSAATFRQVGHWKDGETLFRHALAVTQDNAIAHNNLASALVARGDFTQALPHFERAVAIEPGYVLGRVNYGAALVDLGRIDEALPHLQRAVEQAPDDATGWFNFGNALARKEDWDGAAEKYGRAITLDAESTLARLRLAEVRVRQGRLADAAREFESVVRLDPAHAAARGNLGMILIDLGRYAEAASHLSVAERLTPDAPDVHFALGKAQAALGDHAAAAQQFQRALALRPQDIEAAVRLGDACAEIGRFEEALRAAAMAKDAARAAGRSDWIGAIEARMAAYSARRPWRE